MTETSDKKIMELLEKLSESSQKKALKYIEHLAANQKEIKDETLEDKAIRRQKGFGSWKGKIHITDEFDAPLEDFKGYL
ncbi:MAG: DUF2281 domain-containing protein [Snowella sp.]|nr:DUF2281 domain-containing protein [Snowella sp.]